MPRVTSAISSLLVGTGSPLELVRTEGPLELVEAESPLELVGTENPLELVRTGSPCCVFKASEVKQSCYNSDSTMTVHWLVEVRERFCIPTEYELHVPLPGQHRECHGSGIASTQDLFVACFLLCRGQAGYYLIARSRFWVSGAPSSNKSWKARFFFILHGRGWGFRSEWTTQPASNTAPNLSGKESELVGILRRILSSSRAIKDMTEAWLVEAGLSPAPRGMSRFAVFLTSCELGRMTSFLCFADMFHLARVKKSFGRASGPPAPSPTADVHAEMIKERPTPGGEKRPSMEGGKPPRKRTKVMISNLPTIVVGGSSERTHRDKGKESIKVVEPSSRYCNVLAIAISSVA
ncbi:hypothetical protein BHM03_00046388 [Ensete ventricosum]|uniref:Uncharacterized protein n=1 Tax=Ensete ventricosum TaxID=4639 RepID=A0A445ML23_ENSVE|nr:hypothetical protein BHM03_00046388 [Ensete ventricosum]